MVLHIASHCYIVLLYNCDSTLASKLLVHGLAVVLLSLNYMATKHLWFLNFNLGIVENIIIVIDVLYNFNRLVSLLFLRLG